MLFQKMEENTNLQRKFEQAQVQQIMFISQMMQNPTAALLSAQSNNPLAAALTNG